MTITILEQKMLDAIFNHEFINCDPACAADVDTWLHLDSFATEMKCSTDQAKGVLTSLKKKALVTTQSEGTEDASICFTDEGYTTYIKSITDKKEEVMEKQEATSVYSADKKTIIGKFADADTAKAITAKVKGDKTFISSELDLIDNFSLTEMLILLSKIVPEGTALPKKFSDKPSGAKRVFTAIKALEFKPARKAAGRTPSNPTITIQPKPEGVRGFQKNSVRGKIHAKLVELAVDGCCLYSHLEAQILTDEIASKSLLKGCLQKMKESGYITLEEAK